MSNDHSHTNTTQRALVFAFIINTVFLVIEVSAALYANSLTLLADALHMFTDSASILLAIAAAYFAQKAADELRTYGYHRLEVLGGFLNGLFLIGTVIYIAYDSYTRLQNPSPIESEIVVIIIGILGLVANLLAAYMLTDHQHSLNAKGAYLHLLADAGGSIAAIFAGTLIYFTGLYIIDTIFAIIISIIIFYSTKSLLQETLHILLQGTPAHTTVTEIKQTLEDIDGVVNAHHIHIWALKSDYSAASVHIVVEDTANHKTVLETALSKLQALGLSHPTVQIETKEFNENEYDCYTETV